MISILPVHGLPEVREGDDLAALIASALGASGIELADRDVVVIAQKVVSKAEGRVVALADIEPSQRAIELAAKLVAGRALDAGPLASARALEGMTAVIVNLNRRYKGHAGVRISGIDHLHG